jgi:hypothetical protein
MNKGLNYKFKLKDLSKYSQTLSVRDLTMKYGSVRDMNSMNKRVRGI